MSARVEASLESSNIINDRTLVGTYRQAYTGHAFHNTDKGHIPADSLSLRPFHYILYLSESGRIFIGTQYLGQYGGYVSLQRTISEMLGSPESIVARSYRVAGHRGPDLAAKEVRVEFAEKSSELASDNAFGSRGVVIFKKRSRDDNFEDVVSDRLIPFLGQEKQVVKEAVAALANSTGIMAVNDADIQDCSIIAQVGRKRKVIHVLEPGSFATRFTLDVPLDSDGHPEFQPTKVRLLELLRDEVISRVEDV